MPNVDLSLLRSWSSSSVLELFLRDDLIISLDLMTATMLVEPFANLDKLVRGAVASTAHIGAFRANRSSHELVVLEGQSGLLHGLVHDEATFLPSLMLIS